MGSADRCWKMGFVFKNQREEKKISNKTEVEKYVNIHRFNMKKTKLKKYLRQSLWVRVSGAASLHLSNTAQLG